MTNDIRNVEFDTTKLREQYFEYIDVSLRTRETYNMALRQFFYYMQENNISNPTRKDIIDFKENLITNGHSVSTVNTYLVALRNFFEFLEYKDIYKNISKNIKNLKDTDIHKREALSSENCAKLIGVAKNLREQMLVKLALVCGLRINAIVNIRLEDIKYEEEQYRIYILGKGRTTKQDYVIVPNDLMKELLEYIKKYEINDYLFVSTSKRNYGAKLTTGSIRRIVNSMLVRANLKKDTIVFHSLRHSFATISLENGMDIREVSKALHHGSIVVTERYVHDMEMRNNKCSSNVFNAIKKASEN